MSFFLFIFNLLFYSVRTSFHACPFFIKLYLAQYPVIHIKSSTYGIILPLFANGMESLVVADTTRVTSKVLKVLKGHHLIRFGSPSISNLSFLRILNLRNNNFNGQIPQDVGNLFRLQELYLNNNIIKTIAGIISQQ